MEETDTPSDPTSPPVEIREKLKRFFTRERDRQYLTVAGRLVWFRHVHPDHGIVTEVHESGFFDDGSGFAVFRASIFTPEGRLVATGTARETERGFRDYFEKAETAAVGRALLMLGFGTAQAVELGDERLADGGAPVRQRPQEAPRRDERPSGRPLMQRPQERPQEAPRRPGQPEPRRNSPHGDRAA